MKVGFYGQVRQYENIKGEIDAKCHYDIAIHQQDGYPWDVDVEIKGSLENAERNAASCVSLPMFPELKNKEVDYVVEKVLA